MKDSVISKWKNMARAHAAHNKAVKNRHNRTVAIRAAKRAVKYMKIAKKHRDINVTVLEKEFPISLFKFVK